MGGEAARATSAPRGREICRAAELYKGGGWGHANYRVRALGRPMNREPRFIGPAPVKL